MIGKPEKKEESGAAVKGFFGFPPPLLGAAPRRLAVLGHGPDWIALEKPAGTGLRQHPWDAGVPDLDHALNIQLEKGKEELLGTGADLFASVFYLDPDVSGLGLFATTAAARESLRNAVGSARARFRFHFIAAAGDRKEPAFECDAPLVPHHSLPRMVPSSARGKKTATRFRRLALADSGWALWEAEADFVRPRQIRAHAALSGLPLPGDAAYGDAPSPTAGEADPRMRGPGAARPLFRQLPLHLLEFSLPAAQIRVRASAPRAFRAALRRLGLAGES